MARFARRDTGIYFFQVRVLFTRRIYRRDLEMKVLQMPNEDEVKSES